MIKSLFKLSIVKIYLIFQLVTRIILCLYALWKGEIAISEIAQIFAVGVINDLVSLCYFLPITSVLITTLNKLLVRWRYLYLTCCFIAYFFTIAIFIFITISEVTFWHEFGSRFNFIAVDYLIYTNEIIGTIKESLPYIEILIALIITSLLITFLSGKYLIKQATNISDKTYICQLIILSIFTGLLYFFYNPNNIKLTSNKYAIELGKNGQYEFFSAFFNNSLDYNKFYPMIVQQQSLDIVRANLSKDRQIFSGDTGIARNISASKAENFAKYNVIIIVVESLSAEFMGKFGNQQNITPNLDKLADESILFTNLYAVGTRTVRGLEAITLSVPPTPGSSIIRRPDNQGLFNIGTIFKERGYEVNFIFGGYSYFDNLQNYFQGNGYKIIDRANLASSEISFANIWGVADEDILIKSLEIADQNYASGKMFFSLIMTTSNHRPYSFPAGRIDLPSGEGRSAAVKYTDYAIGKFIELTRTRPWFDKTIFVITADHCASSAGKTDLPINKYQIPLLIYAPKILEPQIVNNLASQIDIVPTILGLMNFSYNSKFFGQDILNNSANRAFISTYQLLGFMKNDYLVILRPLAQPKTYKLTGKERIEVENIANLTSEAISFYQLAYNLYITGQMKQ